MERFLNVHPCFRQALHVRQFRFVDDFFHWNRQTELKFSAIPRLKPSPFLFQLIAGRIQHSFLFSFGQRPVKKLNIVRVVREQMS